MYAVTLLLFGGQLMTFTVMPLWLYWYSYLDVLRFAWGALMVSARGCLFLGAGVPGGLPALAWPRGPPCISARHGCPPPRPRAGQPV